MCAIRYAYKVRLRSLKIQKKNTNTTDVTKPLSTQRFMIFEKKRNARILKNRVETHLRFFEMKNSRRYCLFSFEFCMKKSKLGYATRMYEWLLYVYLFVEKNYKIC